MSEPTRPWWASDPVDEIDRSLDPVEAHRAARRGWLDPNASERSQATATAGHRQGEADDASEAVDPSPRAGEPAPSGDPDGGDPGGNAPGGDDPGGGDPNGRDLGGVDSGPVDHAEQICGVCPVCVLARTVGATRPDLLGHLTEAARHLSAAARSFLEPPGTPTSPGEGPVDGAASSAPGEDDTATAWSGDPTATGRSGGHRRHAAPERPPQRIDLDP